MLSQRFDIKEFTKAVKDKNYDEILLLAIEECQSAESISYRVKGAIENRKKGSTKYAESLKAFIYFMRTGTKPNSISDHEFRMYKSICEELVKKNQFKASILELFN